MPQSKQPERAYVPASYPMARYALGRTTLWRRIKNGTFPPPRFLPGGQRRWLLAELLEWERKTLGPAGEAQS